MTNKEKFNRLLFWTSTTLLLLSMIVGVINSLVS